MPACNVGAQATSSSEPWYWRWISPLTVCLLGAPVAAGLIGTILPAFGYFPPLGGTTVSLDPWRRLFEMPGFLHSVWISLTTGLAATLASLLLVIGFCAGWHGTRAFSLLVRLISPLLSVPHAAVAFGIAFLIAPSGWMMRLISPWATGYTEPPDWLIVHDARGLALAAGLIVKEVPFLLIMTLAAMGQADAERSRTVARTLGYRPIAGWLKAVFPRIYPQIRLPIFAVLAYGVSVVDVAIILGPTTPPPLAVSLVRLFNDPDLKLRFPASAGALVQLSLVAVGIALWLTVERIVRQLGMRWINSGKRGRNDLIVRILAAVTFAASALAIAAGLLSMTLWSFTTSWRFPQPVPAGLTLSNWTHHFSTLNEPLFNTLLVGLASVLIALPVAIGVLESEARGGRRTFVTAGGFLYLPLVVPQIAFLFGGQILLVLAQLDGRPVALTWLHLVFVFPYVFLSLADSYRAWDYRYGQIGLCLGGSPLRVFFRIKIPMLLRPIATAGAVGFAVSVGLYLPTLFAGNGRYPTLITEAVTLSAGGDNRLIGVYTLLQMMLPLIGFILATGLPACLFRHRRGMQVTK